MKIFARKYFLYISTALIILPPSQGFALDNNATPVGESVVAGSATFGRPAAGRLDINQASDRVIINWDRFDIGKNATTHFTQPDGNALAVNRVTGAVIDPTQILGTLQSNGRLMILDRNGVLFGKSAMIDVGGIIASTGDVIDGDIMDAGSKVEILDADEGFIENKGRITVANAGLAAFVAPAVRNSGTINAKLGRIELASGGAVATVDLYGDGLIELAPGGNAQQNLLDHSGKMTAEGGTIAMTTILGENVANSLINLSGITNVSSVQKDGGKIVLRGDNVDVASSGRLYADSNNKHGGEIAITLGRKANIDGVLSAQGKKSGGDIDIARGDGIRIGKKANINTSSSQGAAGNINIGAENGQSMINGHLTSSGATGGGQINLKNGDDPIFIGKPARILSEARDSGKGGDIDVISGEGSHNIAGHLITRGVDSGGTIRVGSRSGINLSFDSLLQTRSTGAGSGGNVSLFVGEGTINYDGKVISEGDKQGGNITMQASDIFMSLNSALESRSARGQGGDVDIFADKTQTRGLISSVGGSQGGDIFLGNRDVLTIFETSRINSEGAGAQGKGGAIFVGADGTRVAGKVTANGKAGGGNITVSGPGGVSLGKDSIVSAKATQKGYGGAITVDSGMIGSVDGILDASGKDGGGQINLFYGEELSLGQGSRLLTEGIAKGSGGSINIAALDFSQDQGSLMKTSGFSGGGNVRIHGVNDLIAAGEITADAKKTGKGGDVDLISDNAAVIFSGDIFSRGGSISGDGGNVSFSSPNIIQPGSKIELSAPNGHDGSFMH